MNEWFWAESFVGHGIPNFYVTLGALLLVLAILYVLYGLGIGVDHDYDPEIW